MLLADVALCSFPGLCPFLAQRNLFLCKLKYIQKITTMLLGACTGIRFTVGLNVSYRYFPICQCPAVPPAS